MAKTKDKAIEQDNNMALWDSVSRTDIDHTKEVSFGRKFTAIDAQYQIMQATKAFGPVGQGWGYETQFGTIDTGREVFIYCDLTFWWAALNEWEGQKVNTRRAFGPIRGICAIQGVKADGKFKPSDHDAGKKAMTDALTKALSHLGFSADVFLGKFEDNKYINELRKEKEAEQSAAERAYQEDRKKFIDAILGCSKPAQIDDVLKNHNTWMLQLDKGIALEMKTWAMKKKDELENKDGS